MSVGAVQKYVRTFEIWEGFPFGGLRITHALGTSQVLVELYDVNGAEMSPSFSIEDANTVRIYEAACLVPHYIPGPIKRIVIVG
jgi:hypothetical protein